MKKYLVVGFFDKIKKGLSVANNFAKSTGTINKFAKYISHVGPAVSTISSSLGMGMQVMGNAGGALNYGCGALSIHGSQCTPGPAFASKHYFKLTIRKAQWEIRLFKFDCIYFFGVGLLGFGVSMIWKVSSCVL